MHYKKSLLSSFLLGTFLIIQVIIGLLFIPDGFAQDMITSQEAFEVFDFGGAGQPNVPYGVRDHKMKFGGDLVNLGRFEIVHNRFLYELANFGFKMKKKLFKFQ